MSFSKITIAISVLIALLADFSIAYAAQAVPAKGSYITQLISHDKHARIAVRLEGNRYDEIAKCEIQDAYVLDDRTEGYDSHRALIMAAYMSGKVLYFTLKGCANGNPRIVGVQI